jgi:hypothetical protein
MESVISEWEGRGGIIYLVISDYILPKVPECLSIRPNWLPPPPLPQASVSPPDPQGEGTHACR